jgi:Ca2+/H+ antiporter
MDTLLNRREALLRRELRRGWVLLVVGLLIPFLALGSAFIGFQLRRDVPREAWPMLALGVAVFTIRAALYLS